MAEPVRELKEISNIRAKDRRRIKRFVDPRDGKVYQDITDYWFESFYGDFEIDPATLFLMKRGIS